MNRPEPEPRTAADPCRQLELGLGEGSASPGDGLDIWHAERNDALKQAIAQLGLPIGHPVEIWLRGGVRLRGRLQLRDTLLVLEDRGAWNLELRVDGVGFRPAEVESCVRLD